MFGNSLPFGAGLAYSLAAFNDFVVRVPAPARPEDAIAEYALAVLRMARWNETVRAGEELHIVDSDAAIWRLRPNGELHRGRHLKRLERLMVAPPDVRLVEDGLHSGQMCVWSSMGGVLWRVEFLYWRDGRVSLQLGPITNGTGHYVQSRVITLY